MQLILERAPRTRRIVHRRSCPAPVPGAVVAPVAAILVAAALLMAGPALAGEVVVEDGVPHVRNGATATQGMVRAEVEELWRVGADNPDVILGLITQVLTDAEGNTYLLDTQLSEVKVFDAGGEFVRTLSGEGDGPGEVRIPADMLFMPDGTLGLAQVFPGKITKIDLDNNPAGEFKLGGDPTQGGFAILRDAQCAGGNLVLCPTMVRPDPERPMQTREDRLASFNDDGTIRTTYLEREYTWDFTNFSLDEAALYFVYPRRFAVGPEGQVAAAPMRDSYVVHVFDRDGTLRRVIERAYEPWQRNEADREIVEAAFRGVERQFPFEFEKKIADTEPVVTAMQYAADGHLWVETGRGSRASEPGTMVTFDVFDPEGNFEKQVAFPVEGDGREDALILNDAMDRAIVVKGFTDGLLTLQGGSRGEEGSEDDTAGMEVVCYAIR